MQGDIKNLTRDEAVAKMRNLVSGASHICMFCTKVTDMPFKSRPMGAQKVDDDGNLYFFSAADSEHNAEINADSRVELLFSNPSASEFLIMNGTATISKDRALIDELWNEMAKAWFPGGKDDPNLTVIKVSTDSSHYWDTKYGKMVTMLAIAAAAVTGKEFTEGVEGKLSV